ncbi:fumarylacetoacetate hydrolase family protein [Parapusillimonas sp. SGNA-6]|nr:fumarylacetoacetate hydrolase family protein [Parapusillimonas sp. SGNA-6]
MRICRYGPPGEEVPAALDSRDVVRDLSSVCDDITPETLSPQALDRLRAIDLSALPALPAGGRFGVPVRGVSKFIGIGLNYRDHAEEAGMEIPSEPVIFMKTPTSLCGASDNIVQPPHSTKLDYEVELGVVIGTKASHVPEERALDYVAGYCVVNDVSERAFQFQSPSWDKGKGCDTFGPAGPWLVTTDEIADPQQLAMWLDVNGERRQSSDTRNMIFTVQHLVAYCSRYMTLLPGDIIATGTPAGVALGMQSADPWLKVGDRVSLSIAGLGTQSQQVVAWQHPAD